MDLAAKKGTIAYTFTKNQDAIYSLCTDKKQFAELKILINNLLDSEELKTNKDTSKAKNVFDGCKNNYNLYISTLITYMTGMKA